MTLNEETHRLEDDFAADLAGDVRIFTHIQGFADYSNMGIISKLPGRFNWVSGNLSGRDKG